MASKVTDNERSCLEECYSGYETGYCPVCGNEIAVPVFTTGLVFCEVCGEKVKPVKSL